MNLRRYLHRFVQSPVRLFASLAIAGSAGLCVAVVGVGLLLSSPATTAIGPPPPDLPAEDVAIVSGAVLRGWFVAGRSGGGAVVLMHGVHANRLSMVERARLLHAAGFSVLLFDFQAHGESAGTRITFGHLEAFDAAAAVAYMKRRLLQERIGAVGTSLGGAAALLGPTPLPVDALVLESVYPDIGAATANRIRAVLGAPFGSLVLCRSPACLSCCCRPLLVLRRRNCGPSTISLTSLRRRSSLPARATRAQPFAKPSRCSSAPTNQKVFGWSRVPATSISKATRPMPTGHMC